uniref:Adenylate kinase isoenzyme 6 n=1 Tax=Timema genevievae TaxID=629358 RepID=A0A7R9JVB0_TIMGE|nr:unnamed protein product [Timema genevievae]
MIYIAADAIIEIPSAGPSSDPDPPQVPTKRQKQLTLQGVFRRKQLPVAKSKILDEGTPGVGKSTLAMQLAEKTGLEWLEVSRLAQQLGCLQEYDEVYQCPVLDEDKLLDNMEFMMGPGGKIVDYHGCDFFPERWFDIVFVLRTNNTLLYDRLTNR